MFQGPMGNCAKLPQPRGPKDRELQPEEIEDLVTRNPRPQGVHNWMFTQSFVRDLVNRFKNPEQRMSFITYSTHGHVNMQLTSD
ncbi:Anthrax toxin receptor-like, partial [Manis javanica]